MHKLTILLSILLNILSYKTNLENIKRIKKGTPASEEELELIEPRKQFELAGMIQKQLFNFELKVMLLEEFSIFFKGYLDLLKNSDKILFMSAVEGLQVDSLHKPFDFEATKPPLRYVGMEMWYDLGSEEEDILLRFPFIGNTPTKDLLEGSSDLRQNVIALNTKFGELGESAFTEFATLITTYVASEFTEPFVPELLPNKCEMTYVMEGDPPALVLVKDEETGDMIKKEDTAAFEACQEDWKTANLENIKIGKKLEEGDDEKAQEIFDETVVLEKEKAELAALAPPDDNAPEPALSETDKVILAGFQDLFDTLEEVKVEWRTTFEEKKGPIMEFVSMLSLPTGGDDGLEDFMKKGRNKNNILGKRKLQEITGKTNSAAHSKEVKAEVQKMIKEKNMKQNYNKRVNSEKYHKEINTEVSNLKKDYNQKYFKKLGAIYHKPHFKNKMYKQALNFYEEYNNKKKYSKVESHEVVNKFNDFLNNYSNIVSNKANKKNINKTNDNNKKSLYRSKKIKKENQHVKSTKKVMNTSTIKNGLVALENEVKHLYTRINMHK